MSRADEVQKAVGAHGMWKARLRGAIETGKSEWTVDQVKVDDRCDFGKWLHSLPESDKRTAEWARIRDLHALFHKEAAKILSAAVTGEKTRAEKGLEIGSDFTKLSANLTSAMMAWAKAAA